MTSRRPASDSETAWSSRQAVIKLGCHTAKAVASDIGCIAPLLSSESTGRGVCSELAALPGGLEIAPSEWKLATSLQGSS